MADLLSAEAIQKIQNDYFIQFMLDTSRMLEELHHKLQGEVLTEEERDINGQKVLVPVWKNLWNLQPTMSKKGINMVMNAMNMYLSVPVATGNISEEQVAMLTQVAYQDFITVFHLKYDEFEFESEAIMDAVANQLRAIIFTHFSKSKDGTFVRQMQSSYSYSEVRDGKTGKDEKKGNMTV